MKSAFKIKNLFHQYKIQKKIILFTACLFVIITVIIFSCLTIIDNIKSHIAKKTNTNNLLQKTNNNKKMLMNGYYLIIPKLKLEAPIIADVDGTNKNTYFKALENGVAQMKGTAKPGEESNTLIFGHSSYYTNSPGNFKEIFKNLDQIKIGDEINIYYDKKDFTYIVTETKIVENNDISIASISGQERITLMTCWPPGTTEKRYVVIAEPK